MFFKEKGKQKNDNATQELKIGLIKSGAGFTLIEILVVLAIIGLIISIIFVNLKDTREKARIAKNFQFYQVVNRAIGAYLVGYWSFNKIDNNTVIDLSGYDNHGMIQGNPQLVSSLSALDKALSFDGNDYIVIPDSVKFDNTDKLTIEFWVYPTVLDGNARGIVSKRVDYNNQQSYSIFFYTNNRLYIDIDSNNNRFYSNTVFNKDNWYYIVLTYDGTLALSQRVKLYVNSALDKTASESSVFIPNYNSNLYIGTLNAGYARAFVGMIDEVKIYNEALAVSEIQKHYAEGLARYRDLVFKND